MAANAIEARNIRVAAAADPRRLLVRDVSFSLPLGGSLAIAGESGSGKTALVHTLFGYMRKGLTGLGGTIAYHSDEHDSTEAALPINRPALFEPVRGRVVALIPQSPYAMLDPIMSVGKQLFEVVEDSGSKRDSVIATLRDVGFSDPETILSRYPHQLSGGQRQRIAISLALLLSPDVLVLDEATTDLDVVTQRTILELIKRLQRERGFALVAVSHDLRVLQELCDDLLILYGGRVVETGSFAELMAHPRHPYTASLVDRFARGPLTGSPRSPYAAAATIDERSCAYVPHCPMAAEQCSQEPPLSEIGAGHLARCWFAERLESRDINLMHAVASPTALALAEPILVLEAATASHREPGFVSRRRTQVLREVSLELMRGECLALVGESGSGKSTLARVIVGLHRLDSGVLAYAGKSLAPKATQRPLGVRKDVQIIFQNPETAFNPMSLVGDVLRRRLRLFEGTTREQAPARLARLLGEVGLSTDYLDRRPSQLSGGEKQRLAIARALIGDPKVLICDEIVSSLDVETQARIVQLLLRLQRERELSLLFISHDMNVVAALAHRIAVLKQGELVEIGDGRSILKGGDHAYTRQLVECAFAGGPRRSGQPNPTLHGELSHGL